MKRAGQGGLLIAITLTRLEANLPTASCQMYATNLQHHLDASPKKQKSLYVTAATALQILEDSKYLRNIMIW